MKKLCGFIIAFVVILLSFLAFASEYEVKGKAGPYDITVRFDRNPPGLGYNNLNIAIIDVAGKQITDVGVSLEYLMPSLPGKPPMMQYSTAANQSDHTYLARIDLSMRGLWTVLIKVTRTGKTDTMKFSFVVQ